MDETETEEHAVEAHVAAAPLVRAGNAAAPRSTAAAASSVEDTDAAAAAAAAAANMMRVRSRWVAVAAA